MLRNSLEMGSKFDEVSDRDFNLKSLISNQGDFLLIVPPFNQLNIPTLGGHILKSCAEQAGHRVSILYANLLFAQELGEESYHKITFHYSDELLFGDRIFASAAYGTPPLGRNSEIAFQQFRDESITEVGEKGEGPLDYSTLKQAATYANIFVDRLAQEIVAMDYPVIGCTTMFHQTAASIALLNRIKELNPDMITVIGGANCTGDLAKGVASLSDRIDYIFSGESEKSFVDFLNEIKKKKRPPSRIIDGEPCCEMDTIPTADYQTFYHQLHASGLGIKMENVHILYETSRGCWWGEKRRCTFCGLYEMLYRMKSPDRVISELKKLTKANPYSAVGIVDNALSRKYFKTLLPRLKKELPELRFFCEQKANLSLNEIKILAEAGAYSIVPGIEALSDSLLKRMDKGTKTRQNIMMMRYAHTYQLYLKWFLLYGFPGDQASEYRSYPDLIPLLRHLNPPRIYLKVQLIRYGLYRMFPERYGVKNLKPQKSYDDLLPEQCDRDGVAYYFDADYDSVIKNAPELMSKIEKLVDDWRERWIDSERKPPVLSVTPVGHEMFLLQDTRGLEGTQRAQFINQQQAEAALVGLPLKKLNEQWELDWALENKVAIKLDGWSIPLATTEANILEAFESKYRNKP